VADGVELAGVGGGRRASSSAPSGGAMQIRPNFAAVANMASYTISSSLILVIVDG
jgi:hypothetical protein